MQLFEKLSHLQVFLKNSASNDYFFEYLHSVLPLKDERREGVKFPNLNGSLLECLVEEEKSKGRRLFLRGFKI